MLDSRELEKRPKMADKEEEETQQERPDTVTGAAAAGEEPRIPWGKAWERAQVVYHPW